MEIKQKKAEVVDVEVNEIIVVDQETGELYVPKEVTQHLALIEKTKKEFKAYEERVREMLTEAMEQYQVTSIDTDDVKVAYIKESETEDVKFNDELLRQNYPEVYKMVYDDCTEVVTRKRKAHVKITLPK